MRKTPVLLQQHAGWTFKRHWRVQGNKAIYDNGSLKALKKRGIAVVDALDVIKEDLPTQSPSTSLDLSSIPNAVELVEHLSFTDASVLVCGLNQAKAFTNTIEIRSDSLPKLNIGSDFSRHDLVKKCIKSSLLYDAHQEKLPKRIDPERPAWNFPRDYGLTDRRKNLLLCNRMVQLCSSLNPQLLPHRKTMSQAFFTVPLERCGEKVVLSLRADILLTSSEELEPPSASIEIENNKIDEKLVDIAPLLSTISMTKEVSPVETLIDRFPFSDGFNNCNVHTAILHFNSLETCNLYDVDVTKDQMIGRSLMKAYTFAIAEVRRRYGMAASQLAQPVTVQCVQTDAKDFHFSILQLNTIKDSEQTDERNYYWSFPVQRLYESCEYVNARPVLSGYNPSVFNTLLAFCCNS